MTPTRRTALITGASGGIGEELARLFARQGCDLVLVARTEAKLQVLAEELTHLSGIHADVIAVDLSEPGAVPAIIERLTDTGVTVDMLVNNAGFATYGQFTDLDPDIELRMVQVNVVALMQLTHLLLPQMVERRWGRILNVASTAAFMPGPLMAVYYASKAFVLSFSEALNEELRGTGVSVTALCPGPTKTGFQARARMQESRLVRGRLLQDAATVARAGYAGLMRGQAVVIPGIVNQVQVLLPRFLPRRLVPMIVRRAQARGR